MATGANIGDVFLRVLADMAGFDADVQKEAAKSGDKAGKTMGQRMGAGLKTGLTAVGAVGGAVFAVAARGAAELTDAMANFQRETGATTEELESARKSVLALSKTNLQSFAEIADTQAALRTDLGLTQDEAEAATDAFLKYGTATGRDAAEGVRALDDIMDAWNLDSSRSSEIMDKLVASHQKYGGSLTENESSLNKLAPQLQALNLDVDDGISLLNLFAEGGLDASKAQFALNSAIKKLPPGTSLEEFVAQLASIEDPAERAKVAIEVFGSRGGAGLANVIRPGMRGLDDFAVGMDDAAGATERAADAIENTPFNQLKMALRTIAAPAIEAGQSFGPLIMALSQLGGGKVIAAAASGLGALAGRLTATLAPTLGNKLGNLLTRVLGRTVIPSNVLAGPLETALSEKGATGKAVGMAGGRLGKAFGIAFTAAAVVGIAALADEISPQLTQLGRDIHDKVFGDDGPLGGIGDALEGAGDWLENLPWPLGPKGAPDWAQTSAAARAGAEQTGEAAASGMAAGMTKDDDIRDAAATMAAPIPEETEKAKDKAVTIGSMTPTELAAAILAKQGVVGSAAAALKAQMESELTPAQNAARNIGFLTSKEFGEGIHDGRSGVRHLAEELRTTGETELRKFIAGGGKIGKSAMDALNAGLKSKNPAVRAEAQRIKRIIEEGTKPNTKPAGVRGGQGVVTGLNSQKGPVGVAAFNLGKRVATYVLKGVTFKVNTDVEATAHNNPVRPRATGGVAVQGQAYIVGERRPEYFVPETTGRIYPEVPEGRTPMGSTGATNINLQTYGLPMMATTPLEVAMQLRRVTSGIVQPRRRAGWTGA